MASIKVIFVISKASVLWYVSICTHIIFILDFQPRFLKIYSTLDAPWRCRGLERAMACQKVSICAPFIRFWDSYHPSGTLSTPVYSQSAPQPSLEEPLRIGVGLLSILTWGDKLCQDRQGHSGDPVQVRSCIYFSSSPQSPSSSALSSSFVVLAYNGRWTLLLCAYTVVTYTCCCTLLDVRISENFNQVIVFIIWNHLINECTVWARPFEI